MNAFEKEKTTRHNEYRKNVKQIKDLVEQLNRSRKGLLEELREMEEEIRHIDFNGIVRPYVDDDAMDILNKIEDTKRLLNMGF